MFREGFHSTRKVKQRSPSDDVAVAVEHDADDLKRLPSPRGIG
jgi:hypothetical protein